MSKKTDKAVVNWGELPKVIDAYLRTARRPSFLKFLRKTGYRRSANLEEVYQQYERDWSDKKYEERVGRKIRGFRTLRKQIEQRFYNNRNLVATDVPVPKLGVRTEIVTRYIEQSLVAFRRRDALHRSRSLLAKRRKHASREWEDLYDNAARINQLENGTAYVSLFDASRDIGIWSWVSREVGDSQNPLLRQVFDWIENRRNYLRKHAGLWLIEATCGSVEALESAYARQLEVAKHWGKNCEEAEASRKLDGWRDKYRTNASVALSTALQFVPPIPAPDAPAGVGQAQGSPEGRLDTCAWVADLKKAYPHFKEPLPLEDRVESQCLVFYVAYRLPTPDASVDNLADVRQWLISAQEQCKNGLRAYTEYYLNRVLGQNTEQEHKQEDVESWPEDKLVEFFATATRRIARDHIALPDQVREDVGDLASVNISRDTLAGLPEQDTKGEAARSGELPCPDEGSGAASSDNHPRKKVAIAAGIRIKALRKAKGKEWTQERLAEATGQKIRQGRISDYETGKYEPDAKSRRRLARALGVKLAKLEEGIAWEESQED